MIFNVKILKIDNYDLTNKNIVLINVMLNLNNEIIILINEDRILMD